MILGTYPTFFFYVFILRFYIYCASVHNYKQDIKFVVDF